MSPHDSIRAINRNRSLDTALYGKTFPIIELEHIAEPLCLPNVHSYPDLLQNLPQGLVRLPGFSFNHIQFLHNLRKRTVGLRVAGVDVAAGGDVVVVFLQLRVIDNAAEFFLFLPP